MYTKVSAEFGASDLILPYLTPARSCEMSLSVSSMEVGVSADADYGQMEVGVSAANPNIYSVENLHPKTG